MIVVCGTETSATIRWSPNRRFLALFHRMQMGWVQWTHANRDRGPQRQFKFSNQFSCPLNPLIPHSAMQWWEECSGVNAVPLVSVLQTHSLQMFAFNVYGLDIFRYVCSSGYLWAWGYYLSLFLQLIAHLEFLICMCIMLMNLKIPPPPQKKKKNNNNNKKIIKKNQ